MRAAAVIAILFLATTLVVLAPVSRHLGDHVPENPGDTLFVAWILAWDIHALTTAPLRLFDANILYPLERTLALSEHLLGVAPLFAAPYAVTGNPILALNAVIILSFLLSGVFMFALTRFLMKSAGAAVLAATIFAFAPVRTGQIGHPQLLQFYWTPLCLLLLERYTAGRRARDLGGFAVVLVIQCLSSVYLAFLSLVTLGVYGAVRVATDRALRDRRLLVRTAAALAPAGMVIAAVHAPYQAVRRAWGEPWTSELLSTFSASPTDFVNAGLFVRLLGPLGSREAPWEKTVSLGAVAMALLVASVALARRRGGPGSAEVALWAVLACGFVLSLGPALVWKDHDTGWTLPYAWLNAAVPGFSVMRVPARFGFLVSLAAAPLAGIGWERLAACFAGRARRPVVLALAAIVSVVFLVETSRGAIPTARVPVGRRIPAVYRWLASQPAGGPIVEVPRGLWEDYRYAYLSTVHWRRLVNGSTGFLPPPYVELAAHVDRLPAPDVAAVLAAVGVETVIVHERALRPEDAERWRQAPSGLELVARFGSDVVYRLAAAPRSTGRLAFQAIPSEAVGHWLALGLRLHAEGLWVHPKPFGRLRVTGRWICGDGGLPHDSLLGVITVPFVLGDGAVQSYSLRVRRPEGAGSCTVKAMLPRLGLEAEPVTFLEHGPRALSENLEHR